MRKTASALLVLSLLCLSAAPASAAPFVRKSEYPKYLYDAPVFKKGKEQKKAVDWLIANF